VKTKNNSFVNYLVIAKTVYKIAATCTIIYAYATKKRNGDYYKECSNFLAQPVPQLENTGENTKTQI